MARDGSLGRPTEVPPPTDGEDDVDGVPVRRVPLSGPRRYPAFFRELLHYCSQNRDRIDLVQLLTLDHSALFCVRRLRKMGIATVYTHTLLGGELSTNPLKRLFQRPFRRFPLQLPDHLVVSSRAIGDELRESGVTTPIRVIPNGVDTERFRPGSGCARDEARRRLGIERGGTVILSVGPITPRKAPEVLLRAFVSLAPRYPDARLVMVGPRHDLNRPELAGYGREIELIASSTGVADRITFAGPADNVEEYMTAADLLVFTSRREGMPNVIPEAMASGVPVVTTPFIGLPAEFGEAGREFVLSSWAPDELAAVIAWLLDDPEQRSVFGRRGRAWVEAELAVASSLDKYAALYRELSQAGAAR